MQINYSTPSAKKRLPIESQIDWRRVDQIRWLEVFDEIEDDLSNIMNGLKNFMEEAEFSGALPFEVEMSALHLEGLVSEVREKLPS